MHIIELLNKLLSQNFEAFAKPEYQAQLDLAPVLRGLTINHMREATSDYTRESKSNYNALYDNSGTSRNHDAYLQYQARKGVWGTDVEAGALADLFDVTLLVTPITAKSISNASFYLRKSTDPQAPIIHLFNSDNQHWHVDEDPSNTIGRGDCLYHAFAQAFHRIVTDHQEAAQHVTTSHSEHNAQILIKNKKIYQNQAEILALIQNVVLIDDEMRWQRIIDAIKESEREDHELAIKLASKEIENQNIFAATQAASLADGEDSISKEKEQLEAFCNSYPISDNKLTILQCLGLGLVAVGLAATVALIILPSVPLFAHAFATALALAGLYAAASAVGGGLGAAAGASMVGAAGGIVSMISGGLLFYKSGPKDEADSLEKPEVLSY